MKHRTAGIILGGLTVFAMGNPAHSQNCQALMNQIMSMGPGYGSYGRAQAIANQYNAHCMGGGVNIGRAPNIGQAAGVGAAMLGILGALSSGAQQAEQQATSQYTIPILGGPDSAAPPTPLTLTPGFLQDQAPPAQSPNPWANPYGYQPGPWNPPIPSKVTTTSGTTVSVTTGDLNGTKIPIVKPKPAQVTSATPCYDASNPKCVGHFEPDPNWNSVSSTTPPGSNSYMSMTPTVSIPYYQPKQ